jgi:hypothetical protein
VKPTASHQNLLSYKEREAKTSELARNVTGDHPLVIEALVKYEFQDQQCVPVKSAGHDYKKRFFRTRLP